jgi:hypothetical protein
VSARPAVRRVPLPSTARLISQTAGFGPLLASAMRTSPFASAENRVRPYGFKGPGVDPKMLGESGYFWMANGWPAHRCVEENGHEASWTCTPATMARIEEIEARGHGYSEDGRILEPWQVNGYVAAIADTPYFARIPPYDSSNTPQWYEDTSDARYQSAMCSLHETPYGETPDGGRRWQRGTPQ